MTIRVLVADEYEARFFDTDSIRSGLRLTDTAVDRKARLRNCDLVTDRPGRTYDRMGAKAQRNAVAEAAIRSYLPREAFSRLTQ